MYYTIYPRSISIVSPIAALVAFQDLAHSCAAGWGWGSTLKSGWGFRWEDAGFMANHAGRCFMSVEPDEFWVSFGCFNAWVGCPEKKSLAQGFNGQDCFLAGPNWVNGKWFLQIIRVSLVIYHSTGTWRDIAICEKLCKDWYGEVFTDIVRWRWATVSATS